MEGLPDVAGDSDEAPSGSWASLDSRIKENVKEKR